MCVFSKIVQQTSPIGNPSTSKRVEKLFCKVSYFCKVIHKFSIFTSIIDHAFIPPSPYPSEAWNHRQPAAPPGERPCGGCSVPGSRYAAGYGLFFSLSFHHALLLGLVQKLDCPAILIQLGGGSSIELVFAYAVVDISMYLMYILYIKYKKGAAL
jgi:hypothetical protein